MEKDEIRKAIKAKRLAKKVTIAEVAKAVGRNPTFVGAVLQGTHKLPPEEAKKVGDLLGLDAGIDLIVEQVSRPDGFPQHDRSV